MDKIVVATSEPLPCPWLPKFRRLVIQPVSSSGFFHCYVNIVLLVAFLRGWSEMS